MIADWLLKNKFRNNRPSRFSAPTMLCRAATVKVMVFPLDYNWSMTCSVVYENVLWKQVSLQVNNCESWSHDFQHNKKSDFGAFSIHLNFEPTSWEHISIQFLTTLLIIRTLGTRNEDMKCTWTLAELSHANNKWKNWRTPAHNKKESKETEDASRLEWKWI